MYTVEFDEVIEGEVYKIGPSTKPFTVASKHPAWMYVVYDSGAKRILWRSAHDNFIHVVKQTVKKFRDFIRKIEGKERVDACLTDFTLPDIYDQRTFHNALLTFANHGYFSRDFNSFYWERHPFGDTMWSQVVYEPERLTTDELDKCIREAVKWCVHYQVIRSSAAEALIQKAHCEMQEVIEELELEADW